ncbi:MAG: hypothetical protein HZB21_05880 [Deltaproteobacteria bacterium]|nr:hypothetical protein [Deltaproteobacteria bacterium]
MKPLKQRFFCHCEERFCDAAISNLLFYIETRLLRSARKDGEAFIPGAGSMMKRGAFNKNPQLQPKDIPIHEHGFNAESLRMKARGFLLKSKNKPGARPTWRAAHGRQ